MAMSLSFNKFMMKFQSTNPNHKKNRIDDLMIEAIEEQRNTTDQTKRRNTTLPPYSSTRTTTAKKEDEAGTEGNDLQSDNDACILKDGSGTSTDEKDTTGRARILILRIIVFLAISGALFGILFATGILRSEDLEGIPILGEIDFEGFFDSDPYGGLVTPETPELAYRWQLPPQQTGLELTILNALTDDWQQEFELAVSQWDAGDPDTLTLPTQRVDVDTACEPVNGALKVCNGNYGATDWRGLNIALFDLEEKWIYASTAQMNDYYLSGAGAAHRQYTMCHELGHGFGLPHWDTNFNNANIGNCMDYTSRPDTNQQPDVANFNFLKELYGVVGGTGSTLQPGLETSPPLSGVLDGTTPADSNNENNVNDKVTEGEEGNDQERRFLLGQYYSGPLSNTKDKVSKDIPDQVMSAYRSILQGETVPFDGGRLRKLDAVNGEGKARLIPLGHTFPDVENAEVRKT